MKPSVGQVWWFATCLFLAVAIDSPCATAQPTGVTAVGPKIGYIDVKRLIDSSPQMIEALARLKSEFSVRDESIKADDAKLIALKQRYDRDSAIMTHDDAEALKRQVEATERSNKRLHDEARGDYATRATVERDRAYQIMQDAVIEFARTQNYDLIVSSPVFFASPHIDVTDTILLRLKQTSAGIHKP